MTTPLVFKYPLLIREGHLDTFGHINNATYLTIFEEARWEAITSRGYGLKTVQKTGLGPVILDIHLKFLKEIRLRETVTIFTQMQSYIKKIGTMVQWIETSGNERNCEMQMVFGLFDLKERKLVEPTLEWKKAIGLDE